MILLPTLKGWGENNAPFCLLCDFNARTELDSDLEYGVL